MSGTISIEGGGSGHIEQEGAVVGTFTIGTQATHEYTGTFNVTPTLNGSDPSTGTITIENLAGSGRLLVFGSMSGTVEIKG